VLAPLLTIIVSVGLGCLLALAPRRSRSLGGLVRTFAVAAALGVVVLHLIPHALHGAGLVGLLFVAGAYLATPLIENGVARVVRNRGPAGVDLRLEAAFAALLVHRIGDGAAMAVGQRHGPGVLLALGAHSIPVVTFVVIAFGEQRGPRHGLLRAATMAAASVVGVVLIEVAPGLTTGAAGGYVDAVVAGTLLHVVAHELRTDPPHGVGVRLVDYAAAAAGVATCLLPDVWGASGHEHVTHAHGGTGTVELGRAVLAIGLDMAPMLLVGLLAAALLQSLSTRFPSRAAQRRGLFESAVRGSVLAAPLPLSSCSVVSISRRMAGAGAAPALVTAFLLATPELGIETLLVTGKLLGWPLAAARLGGALFVAMGAGLAAGLIARSRVGEVEPSSMAELAHVVPSGSFAGRTLRALDELVVHVGAWVMVGMVLAVYLDQLVPAGALVQLDSPVARMAALTVVALPAHVCAPAATPVAAVLVAKGFGVGPVLAGVLLGSMVNLVGMRLLREMYGWGAMLGAVAAVVVVAWGLGLGAGVALAPGPLVFAPHSAGLTFADQPVAWVALVILVGFGLKTSWHVGLRAWLANVFEPRHEGHTHVHVHEHCAEHRDPHTAAHEWDQWHSHDPVPEPHREEQTRQKR